MSENNFDNNKNDKISTSTLNIECKYYNENGSINVTYENVETCTFPLKKSPIHEFAI